MVTLTKEQLGIMFTMQVVVVTLTKEELGIMFTMVLTIPPIRPIFNRREGTSSPLTTGR